MPREKTRKVLKPRSFPASPLPHAGVVASSAVVCSHGSLELRLGQPGT
jgi:hypothetical protein